MILYFDKEISINKKENAFIFLSPLTQTWFAGNSLTKALVEEIIYRKGNFNLRGLRTTLESKYEREFKGSTIVRVIANLSTTKVFFLSKQDYINSKELIENRYNNIIENYVNSYIKEVYLHPTYRCNFNCWYCYNKSIDRSIYRDLPLTMWIEAIQKLKDIGVEHFIFTGGEPLLRNDIDKMLLTAKGATTEVSLLTNGSLLNVEKINQIMPLVDEIIISLDALNEDINAKNRNSFKFQNILKSIRYLSIYYPSKTVVRSVITKENIERIPTLAKEILFEYGIRFKTIIFIPNSLEEISLVPDTQRVIEITRSIEDMSEQNYPTSKGEFLSTVLKCGAARQIIAIGAHGDIYPCQNFMEAKEFKLGNIFNERWHNELILSNVREKFRTLSVDKKDTCRECSYRYLCGGGCPAISWKLYGNLNAYIPFMCKYLKYIAESRFLSFVSSKTNL